MVCLVQSLGSKKKRFESPSVSAPRGPSLGCWADIHLPPAYPRLNPESASSCLFNDIRLLREFFSRLINSAVPATQPSEEALGLQKQKRWVVGNIPPGAPSQHLAGHVKVVAVAIL